MAAPNPNPAVITNELWRAWTSVDAILDVELSGIYANKSGYHNTVIVNMRSWPDDYSIELPLDLKGPRDKARAIDLSLDEGNMITVTKRLKNSALDPDDERLECLREFYGTLDGKTVYGLIHDSETGEWRFTTSDDTHLWHVHNSFFTFFVNNWEKLEGWVSVVLGESYQSWKHGKVSAVDLPKQGDTGEVVKYWQFVHNSCINEVTPHGIVLKVDGVYGPAMVTALTDYWRKRGGSQTFKATYMPGWLAHKYMIDLSKATNPPINETNVKEFVEDWLVHNIASKLKLTADLEGTITLD